MVISVGDWIKLKAAHLFPELECMDRMIVLRIKRGMDGIGGDGAGLYCQWFDNAGTPWRGWVSESSVEPIRIGQR